MFWGSIFGNEKGPCLFWEKEWGTITSARYIERIVPLIDGMVKMAREHLGDHLILMQDAAWDALPISYLDQQIDLMQERCQAVIDAQGGYTPY
ncbi:transposable element Tc1 transposase [Penicillium chermesinum]|uniref:Transposable element Tc1 transposase n=1 Tax=Penicillium chermesinum TaxID=63820 RepID=A0A9W9P9D3_9EURO|nr:transposable element Tc1 transposase [Penicillium chermesinum]KAJ5240212.1 transposable element Tc1 transposase [Penicillium chermesinum]KAJ6167082.1 transposable element Tc1 transposase [Penicillium chermesinum]